MLCHLDNVRWSLGTGGGRSVDGATSPRSCRRRPAPVPARTRNARSLRPLSGQTGFSAGALTAAACRLAPFGGSPASYPVPAARCAVTRSARDRSLSTGRRPGRANPDPHPNPDRDCDRPRSVPGRQQSGRPVSVGAARQGQEGPRSGALCRPVRWKIAARAARCCEDVRRHPRRITSGRFTITGSAPGALSAVGKDLVPE